MRDDKQLLKLEVQEKIERFGSFVVMQYSKFTANMANDFRRAVGKVGGDVEVVRKRILLKASDELGLSLKRSDLEGHLGLVLLGNDPVETIKLVLRFSQDRDKVFKVLAGRLEGRLCSGQDVEKISQLPGKNEMRALLLGTLEAPMSQTLAVIEALLSSVVYCLDNKSKGETLSDESSQDSE